ncbi:hypothetical protein BSPWISOXPB_8869 [uncultured Gammaproteobacteria bacterium]|nr:hypothetical protein BSPWISOXPB_8869 [uncultured Gammaproteobacteria bacterium]
MAENWARDNAYQYATEQVLLMIDDKQQGGAIADLLLHLDNNVGSFQKLVVQMLSKRDQWLTRLYRDGVIDPKVLQDTAKAIVIKSLEELHRFGSVVFSGRFFCTYVVR